MSTELDTFFKSQGLRPMGTLIHFGRKGMKWGQHLTALSTSADNANISVKLAKNAPNPKTAADKTALDKAVRATASANANAMDAAINSLNKGAAHKIFATEPSSPDRLRKVGAVLKKELDALDSNYGHEVGFNSRTGDLMVVTYPTEEKIKHADASFDPMAHSVTSTIKLIYDEDGKFIRAEVSGEPVISRRQSLEHSQVDAFIAHFGTKGMKWGVIRSNAQLARASVKNAHLARASAKKASAEKPKKDESEDAARARNTLSTIKKTKSVASVSDADLNHLVNRMNLEKRYSDIPKSSTLAKTHKRVKTLLDVGATMNKAYDFAHTPVGLEMITKIFPPTGSHRKTGEHAKS